MKIKEVITQTGLTDRAIRLYMEHELVQPECNSTYNGRRSIDFSEADVALLQKVALLRKAGFSLPEIKSIEEEGTNARAAVRAYIDKTSEEMTHRQAALDALRPLTDREDLTMDEICAQISGALAHAKIPAEDLRPSKAERAETVFFRALAILGCVAGLIFPCGEIFTLLRIPYRTIRWERLGHYLALGSIPLLCALIVLFLYIGKKSKRRWRGMARRVVAVVLFACMILSFSTVLPDVMTNSAWEPAAYSLTEDPADYLVRNHTLSDAQALTLYSLFPTAIPDTAEDVKYYFMYDHAHNVDVFEIVAEWVLPARDYEAAKKEGLGGFHLYQGVYDYWIDKKMLGANGKDWEEVPFGFLDLHEYLVEREYQSVRIISPVLIFAFDDTKQLVRYIYSSRNIEYSPYYLTLDW